MNVTYDDIQLRPPTVRELLQPTWPDSSCPLLIKPRCYRRDCFYNDENIGYAQAKRYSGTDIYVLDIHVANEHYVNSAAAMKYWMFSDKNARALLLRACNDLLTDLLDRISNMQVLSTGSTTSICYLQPDKYLQE